MSIVGTAIKMSIENKWVFLLENMLDENGFYDYRKYNNEYNGRTDFVIYTHIDNKKLSNLFYKAEDLMDKLDKIRDKMITNIQESLYGVLLPYQKELGLEDGIGIDSEYDINDSVNELNDTLIELFTYQMRENGLLEVKED